VELSEDRSGSLSGPGQGQGVSRPLGGAPGLLRSVAEKALLQHLQSIGLKVPGVGEERPHSVGSYHDGNFLYGAGWYIPWPLAGRSPSLMVWKWCIHGRWRAG
jgi:hypothetical protein